MECPQRTKKVHHLRNGRNFFPRTWGCLAKVNVPINKKRKLGSKTVDCVFLGYAIHSIGYRFLIINSGVPDVNVGTIMKSRDATFLE